MALLVSQANLSDIPAIMEIERLKGYAELVGQWTSEQHCEEFHKPQSTYLIGRIDGVASGFVILQAIGSANKCVHLKRIAASVAGKGIGTALMRQALQYCFETCAQHRVELTVLTTNARAHASYVKAGFQDEGILRDIYTAPDGSFKSMRMMSILRPEWMASRIID